MHVRRCSMTADKESGPLRTVHFETEFGACGCPSKLFPQVGVGIRFADSREHAILNCGQTVCCPQAAYRPLYDLYRSSIARWRFRLVERRSRVGNSGFLLLATRQLDA